MKYLQTWTNIYNHIVHLKLFPKFWTFFYYCLRIPASTWCLQYELLRRPRGFLSVRRSPSATSWHWTAPRSCGWCCGWQSRVPRCRRSGRGCSPSTRDSRRKWQILDNRLGFYKIVYNYIITIKLVLSPTVWWDGKCSRKVSCWDH